MKKRNIYMVSGLLTMGVLTSTLLSGCKNKQAKVTCVTVPAANGEIPNSGTSTGTI